jgi:hypothetical protein
MDDRGTGELIETLNSDFLKCHAAIIRQLDEGKRDEQGHTSADYEFDARQLVRSAFAYIEGVTFAIKVAAATDCEKNGVEFQPHEWYFILETGFELNDKGEVVERPAQIKLARNIRFAFSLYERAHQLKPHFDPSVEWWSCLRDSMRVRDRLMHPRSASDLDVSPTEVIAVIKAKYGFDELLSSYLSDQEV